MSANLSKLEIMNMAVDLLHDMPLTTPEDQTKIGRALRRNWGVTLDAELRKHPWNFATSRLKLAASTITPVSGWTYGFPLPARCLRVYDLQHNADFEGETLVYAIENDGNDQVVLVTNAIPPLYLKYIKRPSVTGIFDPLFCEALAARLAMKVCLTISGKASHYERCEKAYSAAIAEAARIDAFEGTPERPVSDEWDMARLEAW